MVATCALRRHWLWACLLVGAWAVAGCGDGTPSAWYVRDGSIVFGVFDCVDDAAAKDLAGAWLATSPPAHLNPPSAVDVTDLASLLPADGVVGRWAMTGPPRIADTERLPRVLGDAAGQFIAFGVREGAWVEYANPALGGKAMLRIDIFDMGTPENAFGVYSQRRVPEGKIRGIAAEASIGGQDVLAWIDRFVYTVTIYNYSTDTSSALIEFAERMGRSIVGVEAPPTLVSAVPSDALMLFSHRWFRTPEQRATASRRPEVSSFDLPPGSRGFVAKGATGPRKFAEAFYVSFPNEAAAADAFATLRESAGAGSDVANARIGQESVHIRPAR